MHAFSTAPSSSSPSVFIARPTHDWSARFDLSMREQAALFGWGVLDFMFDAHRARVNEDVSGQPAPASPLNDWCNLDDNAKCRLNRLVLLKNLQENKARIDTQPWPESVRQFCHDDFQRIMCGLEAQPLSHFASDSVRFRQDIRVSVFRRIPLGAAYGEVTGVPRSWILKTGTVQAARLLRYFLMEAGGFRPFLELHVNSNRLEEFQEAGWDKTFRRAAQILKQRPALRGIQCSAWFNDPALETVSPRLAYLRKRYVENGGVCFHVGGSEQARNLALLRSPTRRRWHEEGRYQPCVYMCAWARRPFLKWACV